MYREPLTSTGMDLLEDADGTEDPAGLTLDSVDGHFGADGTPFGQIYGAMLTTEGATLQMLTRTNLPLARAMSRVYNRYQNYGGAYESGIVNMLMRIAISSQGEGRKEMIEMLKAGSGVPGEFYSADPGTSGLDILGRKSAFKRLPRIEEERR